LARIVVITFLEPISREAARALLADMRRRPAAPDWFCLGRSGKEIDSIAVPPEHLAAMRVILELNGIPYHPRFVLRGDPRDTEE
jgi:hypothetical protein